MSIVYSAGFLPIIVDGAPFSSRTMQVFTNSWQNLSRSERMPPTLASARICPVRKGLAQPFGAMPTTTAISGNAAAGHRLDDLALGRGVAGLLIRCYIDIRSMECGWPPAANPSRHRWQWRGDPVQFATIRTRAPNRDPGRQYIIAPPPSSSLQPCPARARGCMPTSCWVLKRRQVTACFTNA
ncbi:hypothetical protein BH10PSE7_BH10PSE7_31440 [soil metagenome]